MEIIGKQNKEKYTTSITNNEKEGTFCPIEDNRLMGV